MIPRRSPTLELYQRIKRERRKGREVWSASTPVFVEPASYPEPDRSWTKLTPPEGLAELRDDARDAFFGHWSLPEHECIISAGAKAAIFSVLRATAAGGKVVVPMPAWPSYFDSCAAAGAEAITFELRAEEDFRIDAERLEKCLVATGAQALIMSNPANPVGRILVPGELEELRRLSARYGCTLILDQSFSSFIFDHELWRRATVRGHHDIVLIDSFSKNHSLQGARVGAMLVPPHLYEPVLSIHQAIMSAAPAPSQFLAQHTLSTGADAVDLTQQRELARQTVVDLGWECHDQKGTFYFFPRTVDTERLKQAAEERGVYILTGADFGAPYAAHFRLCFGRPLEELKLILNYLKGAASQ